jgi:lysophospholipase L1-like esterase
VKTIAVALLGLVASCAVVAQDNADNNACRIFLAGDSTMQIVDPERNPDFGWGQVLPTFAKDSTILENRAKGGRSTKTFLQEGRWQGILDDLEKDNWVIIQFGHNDASYEKQERYTAPVDFKKNLERFVEEVRAKGASPVLLTPVMRRWFDTEGKLRDAHGIYPSLVREVAEEKDVPLVDLFDSSSALLLEQGPEFSKAMFVHIGPGVHNCCPDGRTDNTHFTQYGALQIAGLVVEEIKEKKIQPLAACFN